MAEYNFESLRPHIVAILRAPDVDLATIGGKTVRKQLAAQFPELDIKGNKESIEEVIVEEFHRIRAEVESTSGRSIRAPSSGAAPSSSQKRKRDDSSAPPQSSPPVPINNAPKPKVKKADMTDEEIARKMHEEMNGTVRGRRGAAASSSKSKSPRKKSKVKSKSTVDSDGEGGDGEPPKKKRGGGGFSKPMAMSPELIAVVGTEEPMARSAVVKALWVYIKANDLQDPSSKVYIMCDDNLRRLFKTNRVHSFTMNKYLSDHLSPADEE